MEYWLEWARGPVFRFAIVLMLLGLVRLLILNIIGVASLVKEARDKNIPKKVVIRDTLKWLFPFSKVPRPRLVFTFVSFLFHVSIIVVPIFLGAHILLWEKGLGVSWPAISQSWADNLTLVAIATAVILFVQRVAARASRVLSRAQDYVLPLIIMLAFVSGYLAMHPSVNPFSYNATTFVHVMDGNLILILIPFSKLSHAVLFPATQLVSEMGWHLAPESGPRVVLELGKEAEPV